MKDEEWSEHRQDLILQYKNPLREESHPELLADFPYKRIDQRLYAGRVGAPWHWHQELEIFYMEKGALEYRIPNGKYLFAEGSAGLINAKVLHRTMLDADVSYAEQKIHIFRPEFVGARGSRIYKKYVEPVLKSEKPVFVFEPELCELARASFQLSPETVGYEIELRDLLSRIMTACCGMLTEEDMMAPQTAADEKLLGMVAFIEEHMQQKISVKDIADAVYISERDCYRKFQSGLRETPLQYVQSVRLERACQLLTGTDFSVSEIAAQCGMGDSSYFGAVFLRHTGCTPGQYRKRHRVLG